MKNSRVMIALLLLALMAAPASARPDLCETAAATAAREVGVPVDVLLAIALTETGRQTDGQMRPWPWAANTEGQGHWFATRSAALGFLHDTLNRGQRSIDLGCFQINLRWHGTHFTSPEAMLDPITGARYAARHLADLHEEFGTWEAAAGAYHSRTPSLASRYRARFAQMRASLGALPPPAPARVERTGPQLAGPLFTGTASGASLVPVGVRSAAPLIDLR